MEDVGKQNARLGSFLFWAEGFKMQNGRVAVDWQSKVCFVAASSRKSCSPMLFSVASILSKILQFLVEVHAK